MQLPLIEIIMSSIKRKSQNGTILENQNGLKSLRNDIGFLEDRLSFLISKEEYERAARVHGWLNELKEKYELQCRED